MLWKFIKQCFVLSIPIIVGVGIYCAWNKEFFPDPKYTDNISLNMKLQQGMFERSELDILSIGSSMNLNNLSTKALHEKWPNATHFNFGFWGCDMRSIEQLLPILVDRKEPKKVLITTNLMDMIGTEGNVSFDSLDVVQSLDERGVLHNYLSHWNAPFYLRNMESNKIRFSDASNYEFMMLDQDGGSSLRVPDDKISETRFNAEPPSSDELADAQYRALKQTAKYLASKNIELTVLVSPYRKGILNSASRAVIRAHVKRISNILSPFGFRVVNGGTKDWEDSLYCDSSHYNEEGAYEFTKFCLEQL